MRKFKRGDLMVIKRVAELAALWCRLKWGCSIWSEAGKFDIRIDRNLGALGQLKYTKTGRLMLINPYSSMNNTSPKLISTVIHEMVHAYQPIDQKYLSFFKKEEGAKTDYDSHPFEIEANEIADQNLKECLSWVNKRLLKYSNK